MNYEELDEMNSIYKPINTLKIINMNNGLCKLINNDNTCYINCIIQSLVHIDSFNKKILNSRFEYKCPITNSFIELLKFRQIKNMRSSPSELYTITCLLDTAIKTLPSYE